MFVVGGAGWANSMFGLLAGLRVGGGDLRRGGSCGHVGGGYTANNIGPPPCYVNVSLHVGIRGREGVETSACILMIGGVDCGALGSELVEGRGLEVGRG